MQCYPYPYLVLYISLFLFILSVFIKILLTHSSIFVVLKRTNHLFLYVSHYGLKLQLSPYETSPHLCVSRLHPNIVCDTTITQTNLYLDCSIHAAVLLNALFFGLFFSGQITSICIYSSSLRNLLSVVNG